MTRINLKFRTFVLGILSLFLVSFGCAKADIALTAGLYGLPYQWQMRKTAFYNSTQQELFFGSIAPNSGNGLLLSSINGIDGFNYTPTGLTPGGIVDASGYDTRPVWDMNLVYQGATPTPWLVSIMANVTGTAPASTMYAMSVPGGASTGFSYPTFQNASGTASVPFKVCMAERSSGSVAASAQQVFIVAIAGGASDITFNSTTSGACFRLFTLDPVHSTFVEFSGSKLNASGLGSFGELRDMWWDSTLKRMYCAFTRTDETKIGVCGIYLDETTPASPVLRFVQSGELLTAPASGASLIPYVHKVRTFCANPSSLDADSTKNKYLIINGGRDTNSYNRIYALPLLNAGDASSTIQGCVQRKANDNTAISSHDTSWLDQTNDINNLSTGLNAGSVIAARTVGAGPLPVSPTTPVTDIQISGLNVYVSVADDSGAECIFLSTALIYHGTSHATNSTITSGQNSKLVGWTPWQKVVDAGFNSPVVSFGAIDTGSTKLIALLDNNTVISRATTAFPSFTAVAPRAFSSVTATGLDLADLTTMWRSRQLGVVDSVRRILYAGTSLEGAGNDTLVAYMGQLTGVAMKNVPLATSTNITSLYNLPIWTTGMHGSTLLVVPHTEIGNTPSFGGNRMYAVTDGVQVASNTASDVTDKGAVASRIVNFAVAQKDVSTKFILAAIPESTRNDFSSGHNNCIRSFKIPDNTTTIVPAANDNTFMYDLSTGGAALALQAGQSGSALTYRSLEDMYYDSVFNVVYLGFTKSSDGTGSDIDPGMAFIGWNTAGTATAVSGKLLEGNVDSATGFKHVLKARTLHTRTGQTDPATNRSYLVFNGTNFAGVATDGTGQSTAALNRIYCLPLVVSGSNAGKIATSTTHATAAVLSSATWSETGNAAANYSQHVVGGGYLPTHARSVVTSMLVRGKAVFVSVANPQGVVGARGVFMSEAVTDNDEKLVSWTTWKQIGGGNENIAFLGYTANSDTILAVNHDSSRVEEIAWKSHAPVDIAKLSYQNLAGLAKTLETDFPAGRRGVYHLQNLIVTSNDNATTSYMMGAFGYDSIALAHIAKKVSGDVGTIKYPHKLDSTRYKYFDSDSVLAGIKSLYCIAVPPRLPGWVFAAGYRGLAVLRDATTGRGWTSLPSSLSDTSSGIAITAQSWKQIPDIVGPVYKIVVMTTADLTPLVICMTKKGLKAFVGTEGKFKTTSPDALLPFDASATFSDTTEYMRDIALIGGKMFLVGTTKGLYLMQVNDTNDGFVQVPTQILYNGKLLGPIGSMRITTPAFGTVSGSNPSGLNNAWVTVDVLTARVINDQSEHYQFKIKLNSSGVLDSGLITPLVLQRSFTNLEGKIFASGGSNYYILPGKHLTTSGSVNILAKDDIASAIPTNVVQNDAQIGSISEIAADGARIVTAGGSVYVYKA